MNASDNFYQIQISNIQGNSKTLADYKGKVLLIVNTASKCGFTPQYTGLEELYKKFNDQGFEVLGFPCNQFGGQEPGTASEIQEFCTLNFGVTFPLFAKVDVNGKEAHPLFSHLKKEKPGALGTEAIKWNFTKFLVDQNGQVLERFGSDTKPEKIQDQIAKLLQSTN